MGKHHRKNANCTILDISLEFEEDIKNDVTISNDMFQAIVKLALKSLHGQVGHSVPVEILYLDSEITRAFVQIPFRHTMKVCNSLTLFSRFLEYPCAFRIHQVESDIGKLKVYDMSVREEIQKHCKHFM